MTSSGNVADRAEQRKEFQKNRGIGDILTVERMQKRSMEKEASEADTTQEAKRQRLLKRTSLKSTINAASTLESADVDPSASKKDSLYVPASIVNF